MSETGKRGGVPLVAVLAATLLVLSVGYLQKSPCLTGPWDGREYNLACYTDVVGLYEAPDRDRGLQDARFPYIEAENEYPVLSGILMWVAALPATSYVSFFNWTALLLLSFALITSWTLYRMVGGRALFFALAPTLAAYGFVNWDLLAVALATLATLFLIRGRSAVSGAFLGLGTAAKLYPGLLAVPFAADRGRRGDAPGAVRVVAATALVWAAVNVPLAVAAPDRWGEFFRFSATRAADWDSLWFLLQRHLGFEWDLGWLALVSGGAFAVAAVIAWIAAARRRPGFPPWTFGFPLLVAFLLTNKVYSPQFGLWLLPWFALTLPSLRLFVAFQVADLAVFATRFQWFARYLDVGPGVPFGLFEAAVLARAAVLVVCVVAWVRRPAEPVEATT